MIGGLDLITLLFGAFNLLRLVSYFPQIAAVARDQNGAKSISYSCWTIWVCANASTGVYAWHHLNDIAIALTSGFNASCCAAVLLLTGYKRTSFRRMPASADADDVRNVLPRWN